MSLKPIVIALCIHVGVARADSIEDFGPRRELAQHVFFPSLIVANPFVSTYFALSTAAGYEWIDGPDIDGLGSLATTGATRTRSYRAAAMAQSATFQASLAHFMAIRLFGGGGLDGGSNARSALVVGAVQPITAGAGATLSWNVEDNFRFGFMFDFAYAHTRLLQPLVAVQSSLVAGDVQPSKVSEKLDSYSLLPGVALAIAASESLGALVSAQYSWTTNFDGATRNFQNVILGASIQLDLLPDTTTPLGLMASYRATIPFEPEVRFTQTVEGGLFYTGRKDLDLGLDVQVKWFDLRPDHRIRLDTTQLIGLLELRYHWN